MNLAKKIFTWTKEEAFNEISKKNYWVINFIYFASLKNLVLDKQNKDYYKALIDWDFLLPDWIALKLFLKKLWKNIKENLNWTDFTPYFLNKLKNKKMHLWFFTVYDEKIGKKPKDADKVEDFIRKKFNPAKIFKAVNHYQDKWTNFNFEEYKKSLEWNYDYRILLVWIWTPHQEIWTYKHKDFFKENKVIVLNVWGLFDFWVWFEKRAPKIIRKVKLEWLWRFFQNPKKNYKKVLNSLALFWYLLLPKKLLERKLNWWKK